jgi:Domain of unknown function (DUF4919)
MRRIFGCGVAIVFLVSLALPQNDAMQKYNALAERLRSGDQTVDFTEFRAAVADAGVASDPDARDKLFAAAKNRDFAKMLDSANLVLKSNYADLDAHYFAKIAAKQVGKPELAEFHDWVEMGLLKALRSTGDGRTPETAMKVISVDEEYFILRMMRQQPGSQSLGTCKGNPCDIMKTQDIETATEQMWYFDASIPMNRLAKALGEDKPSKKKKK